MTEIEEEVDAAVKDAAFSNDRVRKCDAGEAREVVQKAMSAFVKGNPRSWWLSLKVPAEVHSYDTFGFEHLPQYIPAGERRVWLIPETETTALPVYDCDADAVTPVLSRCFLFEYYVVGSDYQWLIINTDHGQLVVCRAPSETPS